jgi:polysaccharide biosynthesis transport protein
MKVGQQRLSDLQAQIANVNTQAQVLRSQLGMNSQQALQTTAVSQSTSVQDALKKLQDIEAQLAIERSRFTESNPVILDLKTKAENLRQVLQGRVSETLRGNSTTPTLQIGALQQELTAELAKLEARQLGLISELNNLRTTQVNYQQQALNLPKLEQQQQALEQQSQDARTEYTSLLARYQGSQLAENQNADNVRIVSDAVVPISPTSSNLIYYLASGLLGLLSAGVMIFILEVKGKSIKTCDRAQQRFGFPVLGIIPEYHASLYYDLSNQSHREPSYIQIEEAYRILRANLKSLHLGKSSVIVFTSSVPREGTSTVCANLAIAMARIEHKIQRI